MRRYLVSSTVMLVALATVLAVRQQTPETMDGSVVPDELTEDVNIVISEDPPLTVADFMQADAEHAASFSVDGDPLREAEDPESGSAMEPAPPPSRASFIARKEMPAEMAEWHERRSSTASGLKNRFHAEVADGSAASYWSAIMQTVAESPSLSALQIRDVECRVSVCRVRVGDSDRDTFLAHGMLLTSQLGNNRTLATLDATSMDFDPDNEELTVYLGSDGP